MLARLSPGEARDRNAASGDSAGNVSQVEYTGPTRGSGLSLSLGCCGVCGTHDEEIGQDEGGERSDLLALAVEGAVPMPDEVSANDDDENQDVAGTTAPPPVEVKGSCNGDERPIIAADVPPPIEADGSDDDESRSVAAADTTSTGWGDGVGWESAGTGAGGQRRDGRLGRYQYCLE